MPLAVLHSRALSGLDAPPVTVEVHLATGLPAFNLVGLPDTEVKESRDRVRAALQNAEFEFPRRKITVNLAPADLPKESGRFDLPIALGILVATGQLPPAPLAAYEFAGELALTGDLRPIRGALAMTLKAHRDGRAFVLPAASAEEAALVKDAVVHPARSLLAVCAHLTGRELLPRASAVALVGGGSDPRPGEISLAHHGVLFLDELPEWDRRVLEVLREPLEAGRIHISRAARQASFPARFQFVAAMNPCPCGYLGHPSGRCHCTPDQIARYRGRISGPLLDRIDLQIEVPSLPAEVLPARAGHNTETSATVRARVAAAATRQRARQGKPNAQLQPREIERICKPDAEGEALLKSAFARLSLSARAYHRILKVARTIADLASLEALSAMHIAEAIGYRRLDRTG